MKAHTDIQRRKLICDLIEWKKNVSVKTVLAETTLVETMLVVTILLETMLVDTMLSDGNHEIGISVGLQHDIDKVVFENLVSEKDVGLRGTPSW